MSDSVNVEISGALLVQREVLEMNVRFNRRLLGSAAGSHREIGDAIRRESVALQAREAGEIEVTSGKVQTKLNVGPAELGSASVRPAEVRRTDGGAPGKWSIVGAGIDIVELKLTIGEAEIALQQKHCYCIGHS